MNIDDLKRALVEVHRICSEHSECYDCPFGEDKPDMHICHLSPQLYNSFIPETWDVECWKEDGKDDL